MSVCGRQKSAENQVNESGEANIKEEILWQASMMVWRGLLSRMSAEKEMCSV